MSGKGGKIPSEDEIGNALDKCIADGIIKIGTFTATGGLLSLFLFKRRFWPITLGFGFGIGMAMANCQNKLNASSVVQRNLKRFNEKEST